MIVCSLYDSKANAFSPALSYPDRATAQRAFIGLLVAGDSTPAQWPDDFSLYYIGDFDPSSGILSPVTPSCILTGQSALFILEEQRKIRQGRGGADGGNGVPCPPEASGASAERNSAASLSPAPGTPSSPAVNK